MSTSPRLKLPYIEPAQAQKHVTANESFRRLDALVHLAVKSETLAAEPSAPIEGDAYIIPAGAGGANWGVMAAGAVAAFQDGQWIEHAPRAGWRAWVEAIGAFRVFDGAGWTAEDFSGGGSPFATLGVNATADATNRLAVKSNAALFSHDDATPGSGDARLIINKSSAAGTASAVFQNNFSGRAEFGIAGADDFSLKVSADGAIWKEALVVDKDNGNVGVGGAPASQLHLRGVAGTNPPEGDFQIDKEDGYAIFVLTEYSSAGAANSGFSVQRRARGTLATPAAVQSGDWLGGFSFRGYSANGAFEQRALVSALVDASPSGSTVPTALLFHTGTSALAERLRITSGGDVGIGVSAPSAKLDVDGPVKMKSYLKTALPSASASGAGALIYVSNEAGGAVIAFSDGASWRRATDRTVVS